MTTEETMIDALKWNNKTAPHQQDQWNWQDGVARTLSTATHGAASHLTKTLIISSSFTRGERGSYCLSSGGGMRSRGHRWCPKVSGTLCWRDGYKTGPSTPNGQDVNGKLVVW